jgi:hypothetical protein
MTSTSVEKITASYSSSITAGLRGAGLPAAAGAEHTAAAVGYAIIATPAARQVLSSNISAALIVNPGLSRRVVLGTTLLRPHTHAIAAISRLILQLAPTALRH